MITNLISFISGAVALVAFQRYFPTATAKFGEGVNFLITKVKGLFVKKA
jgi:hypothetical protein